MPTPEQRLTLLEAKAEKIELDIVSLRNALISWREKVVAWQERAEKAQENAVRKGKRRHER